MPKITTEIISRIIMCSKCERGHLLINEKTLQAAVLIDEAYCFNNINLDGKRIYTKKRTKYYYDTENKHVVFDYHGVKDEDIDYCLAEKNIIAIERDALEFFKTLSIEERTSAIRLHRDLYRLPGFER